MKRIIRIQHTDGRGPFRPNFSDNWTISPFAERPPPIVLQKKVKKIIEKAHNDGLNLGCAMPEDRLDLWFTDCEIKRLFKMGFYFVDCSDCKVLAKNKNEVLFGIPYPLSLLPRI